MARLYIGIDGDRIGAQIEGYLLVGRLEDARNLSQSISRAVKAVSEALSDAGVTIVIETGDGAFGWTEDNDLCRAHRLARCICSTYHAVSGGTATVGLGPSPAAAMIALRLGKLRGGGVIEHYSGLIDSEIVAGAKHPDLQFDIGE